MENSLSSAFQLLWIGMLTVFSILFFVVFIGNILIKIVNRYMPDQVKPVSKTSLQPATVIDSQKMAAIISTVSIVTNGKGKVVNVEKI